MKNVNLRVLYRDNSTLFPACRKLPDAWSHLQPLNQVEESRRRRRSKRDLMRRQSSGVRDRFIILEVAKGAADGIVTC
ncbi:hypothetical protein BRADI_4g07931v3 [Brachypodium distachyon]|uniref:Uncharacterized protein n=1 Tax=Brachypodium distachyon TaxID=15368 RepID=A0A2K2CL60_BRADI|nr:hypothetical protein BRADI_4g07931v3 [Brachypodium distachyon]